MEVQLEGCESLSSAEVERVLRLELASVTEQPGSGALLVVRVTCGPDKVSIRLHDPVTAKEVAREIPAPTAEESGGERVVALAISQLFIASWMELLRAPDERPEPEPGVSEEVVRAAKAEAREVVPPSDGTAPADPVPTPSTDSDSDSAGPGGDVSVLTGVRFRGLGIGGVPATQVGGAGHVWFQRRWGLALDGFYEQSTTTRSVGNVVTRAVWVGVGVAHRWRPAGHPAGLEANAGFRVGYVRHVGEPRGDAVASEPRVGAGGELFASVGPRMHAGPVLLTLLGTIGYALPVPEAIIAKRSLWVGETAVFELDDPVSPEGFFAGASLAVGWAGR